MVLRAAALLHESDSRRSALLKGLNTCPEVTDVCSVRTFLQLVEYHPHLILADDRGTAASWAALYRAMSPRSRLLLNSVEPPTRLGIRKRAIFAMADAVLADGDVTTEALRRHGIPAGRIVPLATPIEVETLEQSETVAVRREAYRLAYVGDLSPQHGAADLLVAITDWAELRKTQALEIWWIGEGDLAGVLRAQPLPDNVRQKFLHKLEPQKMAATLASCGLLAVPSLTGDHRCPIEKALASGLPVLGSLKDGRVRRLIREDFNGWLFDPMRPGDMLAALGRAMSKTVEQLDEMSRNASCLTQPTFQLFEDRLRHAVSAVMHGGRARRGGPTARWAPARSAR